MGSSSRAPAPAPLHITTSGSNASASPTSLREGTLRSACSDHGTSPQFMSPHNRQQSAGSMASATSSSSSASKSSNKKPTSQNVNAHSYCGRHSSQYLFGNWSGIFKKE